MNWQDGEHDGQLTHDWLRLTGSQVHRRGERRQTTATVQRTTEHYFKIKEHNRKVKLK